MNVEMNDGQLSATAGPTQPVAEPRLRPWDWGALVLLAVGPFLLVIGWLIGVWLLWTSNRWSTVWKLVGTLAWPVGWAAMVAFEFVQPPLWLSMLIGGLIELAAYIALFIEARVPKKTGA
ncbi:hypothetical protein OHB24_27045 [Kribbella sp. NBC_00482]|uniref:hypothetical protein n=1 Tax=Kribbella sp. NBC_00482 TaxID=2975968 RepID=UPI002E16C0B3